MTIIDHILWAAPDLDQATQHLARLTGVEPTPGGSHPGFGTRNNLLGLGDGLYFEVIAPDPAQMSDATQWGAEIATFPAPYLYTYAIRSQDIDGLAAKATKAGLEVEGPVAMSRNREDGTRLEWSLMRLYHPVLGRTLPIVIDWKQTPHPSTALPPSCRLKSFTALHPDADLLRRAYAALSIDVEVKLGARPGFVALLDTPAGELMLTAR